jgi:outer membrane protein
MMEKKMGRRIAYSVTGAIVASLYGVAAEAAPAVSNFGHTLPYGAKGQKIMLAPNVKLGGDVKQVMLRFVNSRKNLNERLLVSNVVPSLRSYVKDNVLIIKGEGTADEYQQVLRTLAYVSDSPADSFGEQIIELAVLDGAEASVMSKRIIPDTSGTYAVKEGVEDSARVFPLPEELASAESGANPAPAKQQQPASAAAPAANPAPAMPPLPGNVREDIGAPREQARDNALIAAMIAAYHSNEKLMSKRAELKITDELAAQAFSFWMPQISLNGQKGRSYVERPGLTTDDVVEKYGADLNLPLFRGGRTVNRINREDDRIQAERYDLLNTEQETLQDAVASFMAVWRDRALLDLFTQNETVLKTNLDDTQARFSLGEVTQTDVFQSETRHTRAIAERLRAESALKASEARYGRVVGAKVPVAFQYAAPESLHFFDREELRFDVMEPLAQKYHPLIKTAEFDLKAGVEDVDLKKGALLPTISLNANAEREKGGFIGLGVDETTSRSVLFNIDVPLYQSGSEYSEVRQAKLTVEKLQYDLEERKQAVAEELDAALKALSTSLSAIENDSRQVEAAEKALQSVIYESQLGTRTTLDALDAQQEFLEAKILLVRAQHDEVVNTYRLLGGLGRLNSISLRLPVDRFDPEAHYNKVRRKVIGY